MSSEDFVDDVTIVPDLATVIVSTREDNIAITRAHLPAFFNALKKTGYAALTADRGVDKEAEFPTRSHPVYVEVPDSTQRVVDLYVEGNAACPA